MIIKRRGTPTLHDRLPSSNLYTKSLNLINGNEWCLRSPVCTWFNWVTSHWNTTDVLWYPPPPPQTYDGANPRPNDLLSSALPHDHDNRLKSHQWNFTCIYESTHYVQQEGQIHIFHPCTQFSNMNRTGFWFKLFKLNEYRKWPERAPGRSLNLKTLPPGAYSSQALFWDRRLLFWQTIVEFHVVHVTQSPPVRWPNTWYTGSNIQIRS